MGGSSGTEFRVLGPFEVLVDGGAVALGGVKPRLVLAALVLHANAVVPTDRLIDIVWADDPPASAISTLRKYVFRLRNAIEPREAANSDSMLRTCAPGYILDVDPQHVDASRFERLVTDARLGAARGDLARAATAIDAALGLWRGPAWAEFADEEFARTEVARLDELHAIALEARAEIGLAAGRHAEMIGDLEATAAQHSLRERPHAQLMLALYRSGRQTDALRVYQAFRRHVADEVGLEPSPALRDLEASMIRQETTLDWDGTILDASQRAEQATLPSGVVTFLLTDIVSSTQLWDEWPEEMAKALARQEGVIHEVVALHTGHLLKWRGEGDSTLSVFAKATDACAAAVALQRRLGSEVWPGVLTLRTRVALHSGEAQVRDGDYYGGVLNRGARIRALAVGGEILVSRTTRDLIADALPAEVSLIDEGERAMRGLKRREHLYLVAAPGLESGGGLRGGDADVRPGGRRSLIGRAADVERVLEALASPGLVTITGPGGIGKTRLMREIRERVVDDDDRLGRSAMVELAGARDGTAVESAFADALLHDDARVTQAPAGRAGHTGSPVAELAASVGSRRMLIAIDNCEQVLDSVADLVDPLLARCPQLSVLATSREALGLREEQVIPLGPLALPGDPDILIERIAEVDSMQLLLARARDAGTELPLTPETIDHLVELCRVLDGVPLALELAAARLRTTSPEDLCTRIASQLHLLETRRGDPRHRSLHNAIDWSYQLLDASQKRLLRRLAIFVGGFTLDAAEAVCADEEHAGGPAAVYLDLAELVAKSLVMFDHDARRYRLLEPIRLFGREALERDDDLQLVARRHAEWVLRESRANLVGQMTGGEGTDRDFRAELDNAHAALDWLDATGDHDTFLRIVAALGFTWMRGAWRRGREAAARGVQLLDTSTRPSVRGSVLLSRGMIEQRADLYKSTPWLEQARDVFADIGHTTGAAWATYFLGISYLVRDDATAIEVLSDALELFREHDQPLGEIWTLVNLAKIGAGLSGDLDSERDQFERALAIATDFGQTSLRGTVLAELAGNALARGDHEAARVQLREAIELERQGGDVHYTAGHITDAAWVEIVAGDGAAARRILVDAIHAGIETEDAWQLREALVVVAMLYLNEGRPSDASRVLAATGWDAEAQHPGAATRRAATGVTRPERTILAEALRHLASIQGSEYDAARAEGRKAGLFATARAFLAEATAVPREG